MSRDTWVSAPTSNAGGGAGGNWGTTDTSGGQGFNFGQTTNNTGGGGNTADTWAFGNTGTGQSNNNNSYDFSGAAGTTTQNQQYDFNTTGATASTGWSWGNMASTGNTGNNNAWNFGTTSYSDWDRPKVTQRNEVRVKFGLIRSAVSPFNPRCRLDRFLYNGTKDPLKILPSTIKGRVKYQKWIKQIKWDEAVRNNPTPNRAYPIPCRSFSTLMRRVLYQQTQCELLQDLLTQREEQLLNMRKKQKYLVAKSIAEIKERQLTMASRIIAMMRKLEVLVQLNIPVRGKDFVIRNRMKRMEKVLNGPNQLIGKINELEPRVETYVKRYAPQMKSVLRGLKLNATDKIVVGEHIKNQTVGLEKLLSVLEKDKKDLNLMIAVMKRSRQSGGAGAFSYKV